jgi:hypothetical protein
MVLSDCYLGLDQVLPIRFVSSVSLALSRC